MTSILDNVLGDFMYMVLVIKDMAISVLAHIALLGYWAWRHPLFAILIIIALWILRRQMKQHLRDMWFIDVNGIEEVDNDRHQK